MSQTNVSKTNPIVAKLYGTALFAGMQKSGGLLRNMTGSRPTEREVSDKIGKLQSSAGMPIVEIMDLSQTAGQTIGMDCVDVVTAKPIMGDRDASGKGSRLTFSTMDMGIDQWTFPVSAGGRMSQQRTIHNLRKLAKDTATGLVNRLYEQRNLIHLAGARGDYNSSDWVVPLATDPDYAEIMVNTVKAPTYNRHFVVDGTDLVQGGQQLSAIDATDKLTLAHIDGIRNVIDNLDLTLQPIKLEGDQASEEALYALLVPPDVWSQLLIDGQLRAFQQNAVNRASAGNLAMHPLFKGEVGLWNGILVKKANRFVRFNAGSSTNIITQANAATATESGVTVNAAIGAGFAVNRCLLLGAQALGCAYGKDSASGYHYSWGEEKRNFDRETEFAVFGIEGSAKVRFSVPDANGNRIPTDHGVIAIDVVAKRGIAA